MKAADPSVPGSALGAVVDQKTVDRVTALVADALAKGATLSIGASPEGSSCLPM
jgi:acyl-CoA reductase-like NAD-dependent aldehyde dehydrogenase